MGIIEFQVFFIVFLIYFLFFLHQIHYLLGLFVHILYQMILMSYYYFLNLFQLLFVMCHMVPPKYLTLYHLDVIIQIM